MSAECLSAAWCGLRIRGVPSDELLLSEPVKYEGDDTSIEVAVDSAGVPHLIVPVRGPASRELPPDFNGLRLRAGRFGGVDCLDLQSSAAHQTMFASLCWQVVEAIQAEGREPWAAAISTVLAWHSAWKPLRQAMSFREQIGLAGELLILKMIWLPAIGLDAIHHWSGPDRERHDFVTGHLHMEVKTTTRSRHEHEISRFDQLMVPKGRRLLLASVQLEKSTMGDSSIATLIDELIENVRPDPAAVDGLLSRLSDSNWSDEMRTSPDLVCFHVRDVQVFEVNEEFPCLPQDFDLPAGVLGVKYTISLANLPILDPTEVFESIVN